MPVEKSLNFQPTNTTMNPSEDPADRLLDSLLREQHRNSADEPLLAEIQTALDNAAPAASAAKHPAGRAGVPPLPVRFPPVA